MVLEPCSFCVEQGKLDVDWKALYQAEDMFAPLFGIECQAMDDALASSSGVLDVSGRFIGRVSFPSSVVKFRTLLYATRYESKDCTAEWHLASSALIGNRESCVESFAKSCKVVSRLDLS